MTYMMTVMSCGKPDTNPITIAGARRGARGGGRAGCIALRCNLSVLLLAHSQKHSARLK